MKFTIRRLWAAMMAALTLALCGCTFSMAPEEDDGMSAEEREEMSRIQSVLNEIGFATEGVTVVDDSGSLSDEVRRINEEAQQDGIRVEYKNQAFSSDGVEFDCYIGNPADSQYNMFIDIYDANYENELFLSQLIRPGQAFEQITLLQPVTENTTANVIYTQVEVNDEGELAIRGQTIITLELVLLEEDS